MEEITSKVLEVCKPKIGQLYKNKMKFTINFQNYLTPFFDKYSATLKSASSSKSPSDPDILNISRSAHDTNTPFEIFQNPRPVEKHPDMFQQPPSKNLPTSSNPFDLVNDQKNMQMLLSQPQKVSKIRSNKDFDFSDLGDAGISGNQKKKGSQRFEGKGEGGQAKAQGRFGVFIIGRFDVFGV